MKEDNNKINENLLSYTLITGYSVFKEIKYPTFA